MKATDVNRVLEDTLGLVEYELKKGKVKARPLLDPAAPPVWGDGEKLKQVFLNLIVNATHAMPEGGELEVRTFGPGVGGAAAARRGRRVVARRGGGAAGRAVRSRIRIADRGSGIPARDPREDLRAVLLDQGGGQGDGARPVHLAQHRARAPGAHRGRERRRRRDRLHDQHSDGGRRAGAGSARTLGSGGAPNVHRWRGLIG